MAKGHAHRNPLIAWPLFPGEELMKKKLLLSIACAAAFAAGVSNAAPIVQTFSASTDCGISVCGTSGGSLTFEEITGNRLKITIDNTTDGTTNLGSGYRNSSAITGFVFNVNQDITLASVESFANSGGAISGWTVGLNVNNETTPGNTVFDVAFETTNGINNGIYNAADPGSNIANVVPDIATLIIAITDPISWDLVSIGGDSILRMQRVGLNGEGSLKIPTSTSSSNGGPPQQVPEPGSMSLALLAVALLGASLWNRRRTMLS
jgi:hypothetical protein